MERSKTSRLFFPRPIIRSCTQTNGVVAKLPDAERYNRKDRASVRKWQRHTPFEISKRSRQQRRNCPNLRRNCFLMEYNTHVQLLVACPPALRIGRTTSCRAHVPTQRRQQHKTNVSSTCHSA